MRTRKFCFLVTVGLLLTLFYSGTHILSNVNQTDGDGRIVSSTLGGLVKPFKADKTPFNVLFMVKEKSGKKTDTMFLVNYDPANAKLNAMSIPRDTYYPVKGTSIPKINAAYECEGPSGAVKAVSSLLNVDIKYHAHVNIDVIKQVVDLLGGVNFDVPAELYFVDSSQDLRIHLKPGRQRLDGDKAEQLLRFRKTMDGKYEGEIAKYYDGSDLKREEMQRKFIKAFIEEKMSIRYLPKINDVVKTVTRNIDGNIGVNEMLRYAASVSKLKSGDIRWHQLPGESKRTDYWYFMVDKAEAAKITAQYFPVKGTS